jgi:ribosome-associated protein
MELAILPGISIDSRELRFTFARSGGPGGQNVNKVNTCVTLWFDLRRSASLSDDQRRRLEAAMPGRIDSDGLLRVTCREHRTQAANRRAAIDRLVELLATALRPRRARKASRPTRASKERRLEAKRRQSRRKQDRSGLFRNDA